jgi:hypothetical protein
MMNVNNDEALDPHFGYQLGGCSHRGIEDLEFLALCIHILIIVVVKLVKKSIICNEITNFCY